MVRPKSDKSLTIRRFVLRSVSEHPRDLVRHVSEHFSISRQAALNHVNALVRSGDLEATGSTRQRIYSLRIIADLFLPMQLPNLEEDEVWRTNVASTLADLQPNVLELWHYGFTEMVNNAIDHSAGSRLIIVVKRNAAVTNIAVLDDGVGIFRKIKEAEKLEDERHAVLELAKGKLTTDPDRHTGEGIFFTSRVMDDFEILSGDVYFTHEAEKDEDWILEVEKPRQGTSVFMGLDNFSERSMKDVFSHFASDSDDYGFTKTVVPVRMAKHGAEQLISRSQAKRLLARLDRFRTVLLDFEGVDMIGRSFADEIFRVFARAHPDTLILPIKASNGIASLIQSARAGGASNSP